MNKVISIVLSIILISALTPLNSSSESSDKADINIIKVKTVETKEQTIREYIREIEKEYGIKENIIYGLIKVESNFNPDSVGDSGDSIGYCQIQPKWWNDKAKELGLDIYEPKDNIELCAYILKRQYKVSKNWKKTLSIYNSGNESDGLDYADKVFNIANS